MANKDKPADQQRRTVEHKTTKSRTTPEQAVDRLQKRHEEQAKPDPEPRDR